MDNGGETVKASGEIGPDDVFDAPVFENETCGICMDIVIDRGVLDCCSHWFCFACIDNWAAFTNLCPICKKEFQLITCLPVYDTVGNAKFDEQMLSRDDDWYIQGKNNTLSFPSYYINEDAVICLVGDDCKIRNRLPTEEDLNLDTSIACDSCDIWYHAFCVEFDPEQTLEDSWLCPRCLDDKQSHMVDDNSEQKSSNHYDPRNAIGGQTVDSLFSGKVSISVADAGETAIVVSMVEGKPTTRSYDDENLEGVLNTNTNTEIKDETHSSQFGQCSNAILVDDGVDWNFSGNTIADQVSSLSSLGLSSERTIISSDNFINDDIESLSSLGTLSNKAAIHHDNEEESSLAQSISEVEKLTKSIDDDYRNSLHVDHKNQEPDGSLGNHTTVLESLLRKDAHVSDGLEEMVTDSEVPNENSLKNEEIEESFHLRKGACARGQLNGMDINCLPAPDNFDMKEELKALPKVAHASDQPKRRERDLHSDFVDHPMKNEFDEGFCGTTQRHHIDTTITVHPIGCSTKMLTSEDSVQEHASVNEGRPLDIMSIVQDNNCKSSMKQPLDERNLEKSDGRPPGVGLRVKKILRRVEDDKEPLLVQKLKDQIKETVSNEELSDIIKDGTFDDKLLSAFRAAMTGSQDKTVSKIVPSLVRAKKSMLQKGKVRENLTKKIYGLANGKRKRAWDRDWEVEFWKHRCTINKPEKVKTLQSVLDVLKKIKSSSSEIEHGPEKESADSVLSRIYLADLSVFPRTDDVKPLSAFTGYSLPGTLGQQEQHKLSPVSDKILNASNAKMVSGISSNCSRSIVTSQCKRVISGNSIKASSRKDIYVGSTAGDKPSNSDSARDDNRKWALEILARKNALANKDASQRKEDNNPQLKENYPLLAQLPMDMRPTPAPSHRSKIPMSVRQAQLYRLTEHYLRIADVPVIQRTADVELAVADAANIEKEICERSKSKLVYMNLCSQHIIHSKPHKVETEVSQLRSPQESEHISREQTPGEMTSPAIEHDSVEDALREAGLLSDSPPDSPLQSIKYFDKEDNSACVKGKDIEKHLDLVSHHDLDICGDFDDNLGEDYDGSSIMGNCLGKSQFVAEHGDFKLKVVLSAISADGLDTSLDTKGDITTLTCLEKDQTANVPEMQRVDEVDPCRLANRQHDGSFQSTLSARIDAPYPVAESLKDKILEEPSWLECEEVYGPTNKDIEKAICEEATGATSGNMALADDEGDVSKSEKAVSFDEHRNCRQSIVAGSESVDHETSSMESSLIHSLPSEHIPSEQISMSVDVNKLSELSSSVSKKVEAYIKEHIRPLCKSGIITAEQYRWAVGKATEKVMRYHSKAKNANFLIKEGEKVKKLAEEYVESSQRKEWRPK